MFTQIFYKNPDNIDYIFKQAEAEVVPSSSLVELEVEVGLRLGWGSGLRTTNEVKSYFFRQVGGIGG